MVSYGNLAVGSILVVISILFFIYSGVAFIRYQDNMDTLEEQKKTRDDFKELGLDTSDLDSAIDKNEEIVESNKAGMTICSIIGLPLFIIGLLLIFMFFREKNKENTSTAQHNIQPYWKFQQPPQ